MTDQPETVDVDALDLEPDELVRLVQTALDVAEQARAVLELAPDPLVSPVVIDRRHFAPLQAAVDAFDVELEPFVAARAATQEDPTR